MNNEMTASDAASIHRRLDKQEDFSNNIARMQEKIEAHTKEIDRTFDSIKEIETNTEQKIVRLHSRLDDQEKREDKIEEDIQRVAANVEAWERSGKYVWVVGSLFWSGLFAIACWFFLQLWTQSQSNAEQIVGLKADVARLLAQREDHKQSK